MSMLLAQATTSISDAPLIWGVILAGGAMFLGAGFGGLLGAVLDRWCRRSNWKWLVTSILLVVCNAAMPSAVAYLTWTNRHKLDDPDYRTKFGFLFFGFAKEYAWWEVVVMLRKASIAVLLVFVTDTFLQSFFASVLIQQQ